MKVIKNYEDAIYFLKHLPEGTESLDVIISYSADQVEITYSQKYPNSATPHYIVNLAHQYIEDINKAIRKEHEVPLEVVDSRKTLKTQSYSLKAAIELLKNSYDVKFNELEVNVHPKSVTIISREENEDLQFIPVDGVKLLIDSAIERIEDALKVFQEENEKEQRLFEEKLKESPMPKVKDFFEGLISKLDTIDTLPIESIKEKAEQLIKEQRYDKWEGASFSPCVIEMKKLLEALNEITEDSFFERIKNKVESFNRQVIAINESRKELNKLFADLPNKEKFSVTFDQAGFVDVVQVPSVAFIKRIGVRFANSEYTKIQGFVYELQQDGTYIEVLEYDMKNISVKSFSDDIIISEERVPFNRFTITKSGERTFAVEVIDKPVF